MPIPTLPEEDVFCSIYKYCHETGKVFWTVYAGRGMKPGMQAGTINKNGYSILRVGKKRYPAHRLIWKHLYKEDPVLEIDHIDGNPSNNRKSNLRLASRMQNSYNRKLISSNTSGVKGVTWVGFLKKWKAQCGSNGRMHYLGVFKTIEEAHEVLQDFRKKNHGQFMRK